MVFSSTIFIFCFIPIVLMLYLLAYKLTNINIANYVLLISSVVFYAYGGIKYLIILILLVFINYILTILMEKYSKFRKILFITILCLDLSNLLYFKYFNFFVENFLSFCSLLGFNSLGDVSKIILPIGISFYTFQIISYVVDVYKGIVPVQRSFSKLALYVMMFPQLIAGPIVRYKDVNDEIDRRIVSLSDVEYGIKRFIIGFAKKIFIANAMGNMADCVFGLNGDVNFIYAWIGAICYSLQIYYDFSAYSDMAIGLGRILGFHFNENFDLPYKSQSIQEFWRRWHISLSTWFKDYVYIPLGGNRNGIAKTYRNLGIVFLLTGFWHGAAWQFIGWGLYHGFFQVLERVCLKKQFEKIPSLFRHIYSIFIVVIGWVFFRADNISQALKYLKNMFSLDFNNLKNRYIFEKFDNIFFVCFAIAIIFSVCKLDWLRKIKFFNNEVFVKLCYTALFFISVLYLTGLSYNPFIYFKF